VIDVPVKMSVNLGQHCAVAMSHQLGDGQVVVALHVRNDNRDGTPPLVRLKAVCGPGDEGESVVTVMLPDQD
jgi:hypothetical protein